MDVVVKLSALALCLSLTACSFKSPNTVFNRSLGSGECASTAVQNRFIVQWEDGSFSVEYSENADKFTDEFITPNLDHIRHVEFDHKITLTPGPINETAETQSFAAATEDWGQQMIEAPTVWNQGVLGEGVTIAVIDSYIDYNNPQLYPRIAFNTGEIPGNGIDDDGNGYVDDYIGYNFISNPNPDGKVSDHGTHVSGIAVADHGTGRIKGIAPRAKLIPAPFIDAVNNGNIGDAVLALDYARKRGAKIVNASWGGSPCNVSLQNAIIELGKAGTLVVVAAGNDKKDIDYQPDYPAAFNLPNQLTIAAATPDDFMASWSNRGFSLVHLAAPGEGILSTIPKNQVKFFDGTSMAAPFVSGAAALLWSDRPQATLTDVKTALMRSVDVTPNHEYKVQTLGRLNIRKALEELRKLVP